MMNENFSAAAIPQVQCGVEENRCDEPSVAESCILREVLKSWPKIIMAQLAKMLTCGLLVRCLADNPIIEDPHSP